MMTSLMTSGTFTVIQSIMNVNENKIFFQYVFLSVRCRYICCVSCPAMSALYELAHGAL